MIGRRPMIALCLIFMALGMFLSATSSSVYQLAAWRVITGLGIGGMLASINTMTAEYANDTHRDFCVSLNTAGYPIGGVLGGLMAAWLLGQYDWRSVFIFGGIVTALMLPVVWLRLPESIEFLAMKRGPNALERINGILTRMGHRAATELTETTLPAKAQLMDIFRGSLLSRTLIVCAGYFLHIMTFYYVLGWIPSIVNALGFTAAIGAQVSVLTNLGGIIGIVLFGYCARFIGIKYLAAFLMIATAIMLTVFGRTNPDETLLKFVGFSLGFFMFAGVMTLYALLARVYPTHVRVTGTGFALGLGRVGGIMGPTIGGWLMAAGINRPDIAAIMALGSTLAAVSVMLLSGEHAMRPSQSVRK